ncbi:MAG TPA: ATP-binding cassette domain-containing protein [Herpetosiphonaceae bacterium]
MIQFEHVSYSYPNAAQPVLHDVSLTIAEGDFVLVAGASGTGKSTFLRCLNGLVPHFYGGRFGGRVRVAGYDTRSVEPRDLAGIVGFVFQDPEAQMVVEVVEDELVFGMENLGLEPQVMRRRVEEVLDQLEIAHLRRRRITTLSGGERQRVAIASVLAMQPHVLVLDEPTSQLDPHTAEEVLTALQKLNADLGLTIVLSEHRLERVVQYADRLLVFERQPEQPPTVIMDTPRAILARSELAPPLVQLSRALGWEPLPLTIKEGRRFVLAQDLDQAAATTAPQATAIESSGHQRPRGGFVTRRRAVPERAEPAALRIDNLSVELAGRDVLHQVSLEIGGGELVAIMGRNGSGKTTLLRAIMGLVAASRGSIAVGGRPITALPTEERAKLIGYVPQDPRALLFQETVGDELRWTLWQRRSHGKSLDDRAIAERIERTLALLDLQHLATAHPREISGGEQQRAALATILVAEPTILLLDEPTRGLDYRNKALLIALLEQLSRDGRGIALVTHDVELVAACADRVVLLGEGEVIVAGAPQVLLNDSLIFSSQIGKLFRHRPWLTVDEALRGIRQPAPRARSDPGS